MFSREVFKDVDRCSVEKECLLVQPYHPPELSRNYFQIDRYIANINIELYIYIYMWK